MSSIYSPNRAYEEMSTGSFPGTWGVHANANLSIIDLNFGGRLSIDASGSSDVTVSATQARNVYQTITGVLTGNISYILPAEGMRYLITNSTTGAFSITAKCVGGTGIVIPQGTTVDVFVNPDTPALVAASNYFPGVAGFFVGGTTSGTNTQTVTLSTTGFSWTAGYTFNCTVGTSPTGAFTINPSGAGAKNVFKVVNGGVVAAGAGDMVAGQTAVFVYDGTEAILVNPAPAIEITMGLSSTPPVGKFLINGDSIGSATSGGTHAAAIYANLYAYWWNNVSDTYAPVTTGRGISAAADFAADKKLTMPNWADKSPYGIGSAVNAPAVTGGAATVQSTGTVSGSSGTTGSHTLIAAEVPALTYTTAVASAADPTPYNYFAHSNGANGGIGTTTVPISTNAGGGGHTHPGGTISATYIGDSTSVLHPVFGIYYYISY